MADDLGLHELGCYGQTKIKTPNLDRLATEGVVLDRFYSASTVCAPTRCSLLTGYHTGHGFVRGNKEVGGWDLNTGEGQIALPSKIQTFAESLKDAGYTTGVVGKWALGGPATEGRPRNQGFDFFFGYLCQRRAHNYTPTHLWRNDEVFILDQNRYFRAHQRLAAAPADIAFDDYMGPQYAPEVTQEQAEQFIRSAKGKPYFLYYASTLPHASLQAPKEWVDRYPRSWDTAPYLGQNGYLPNLRPRATYAAMVSYLDDCVGRLMRLVDELGQSERTIFVFKADNGTAPNGGVDRQFFNSLGPLRGLKTNLYEGGIRVPFIARWKGTLQPGRRVKSGLWSSYDVMPTVMDLAGLNRHVPKGIDGISFAPTLLNKPQAKRHPYLYFEFPEGNQQQAILTEEWKLIRPNLKQTPSKVELYHLESDPSESKDVHAAHPKLVEDFLVKSRKARTKSAEFPIPALDR